MATEHTHTAQKAQMNQLFELADKSLDETEKLVELNFSVCHDTLQELARCYEDVGSIRDVPSAFNWQAGAFKPFAELSAQYGARLMGLASNSGRELSRSFENQWQGMTRQMTGWMGDLPQPGTQGPDAMFDYLRNTMKAFDKVWESTRQNLQLSQDKAMEMMESPKTAAKSAGRRAAG